MQSDYMHWAKTQPPVALQSRLERSAAFPHGPLGRSTSPTSSSTAPATTAIRRCARRSPRKCGVTPDRVVMADGTSMANMLAMAALIAPGDEVLAEHPAYEPMVAAARFLGAEDPAIRPRRARRSRSIPTRSRRRLTPANAADPAHQSAQSDRQSRRRGDAARAIARSRRPRADRRGLSRRRRRSASAAPARRRLRHHLEPHQGLRPLRPALRLDPRRARRSPRRCGG